MHQNKMLVDTHCHIHEADYPLEINGVIERATAAGVGTYVCVGTSIESSAAAIHFAETHAGSYASIGVHPHDTKDGFDIEQLAGSSSKIIAVGEIGLDYYYEHSSRQVQQDALEAQLDVAEAHNLPVIFHVRDAFDDFWPILDNYDGLTGIVHSFTDTIEHMQEAVRRGFYIGINGISTFTKDPAQQAMFDAIPLHRLVFETDAPFLTPHPFRGKVNEPAYLRDIAIYHAARRGISVEEIAAATTANARAVLRI